MTIYCPQNATTYSDLAAFHSATANSNFGELTVGEVSGATTGGYLATYSGQFPHGLELRAAIGQEFNGVFGLGAKLTGLSFETRHGTFTRFKSLELTNATTSEDIVTQQLWEGVAVTVDSCGLSGGRIGIAPKHGSSVFTVTNSVIRATYKSGISRVSDLPVLDVQGTTAYDNNQEHGIYAGGISRTSLGAGSVIKNSASFASYYTDFYRPDDAAQQSNLTQTHNASGDTTAGQDYNGVQQPSFNALNSQDYTLIFEDAVNGDFRQKATSPLLGAGELGADIGAFAPVGGGPSPQTLYANEIVSAELFGTPTIQAGAATLLPVEIPSAENIPSPTLLSTTRVFPSEIASAEAFGTAAILPGQTAIQVTEIASAEDFGLATLVPGTVSIFPSEIASNESFGTATLNSGVAILYPLDIPSGEAFDLATIVAGTVTVQPNEIPSAEAFGTPLVSSGGLIVAPISIDSGEVFDAPLIQAGTVLVSPASILSGETFGNATLYAGAATLQPASIPSAEAFDTPTIQSTATLQPASIDSAEAFGVPLLVHMLQFVQIDSIQNGEVFGRPILVGDGIVIIGPRQILNDILSPILHDILKEVQ